MNYDLCSGTCLKKSGIYSVAMFQQNKNTRQPLSLQGWRVFLYDRAKLSKGLKSGNLGTSFRVVE